MPGHGKNYCVTCSRYFATPTALQTHSVTKAHKRRCASVAVAAGRDLLPYCNISWPRVKLSWRTQPARLGFYCRIKELQGARPHNQSDAEAAAGMGKPDNGMRLQPVQMEQ